MPGRSARSADHTLLMLGVVHRKKGDYQKAAGFLQELLKRIDGLNVALLQVRLRHSDYRILYNDELKPLFDGNPAPLEPIEDWLRERISSYSQ